MSLNCIFFASAYTHNGVNDLRDLCTHSNSHFEVEAVPEANSQK